MTTTSLEDQLFSAAVELVARQDELLPRVAEALGADPYEYWILRRFGRHSQGARGLEQRGRTVDGEWGWFFHGLEVDIMNLHDRRMVRVDFGPGGRRGVFTDLGVATFACTTKAPWPEFPDLREHLRGPDEWPRLDRCATLARSLLAGGRFALARPDLVELCNKYRRRHPGGGTIIDVPPAEMPDEPIDLAICDRLVLGQR